MATNPAALYNTPGRPYVGAYFASMPTGVEPVVGDTMGVPSTIRGTDPASLLSDVLSSAAGVLPGSSDSPGDQTFGFTGHIVVAVLAIALIALGVAAFVFSGA